MIMPEMRRPIALAGVALLLLASSAARISAGEARATFIENPKYRPLAPRQRGKTYRPPGGPEIARKNPIIWAWRLELADGSGLAFGGYSIRTDDPKAHTRVKRGGKWVDVHQELRRKNPLQKHCDELRKLRRPLHRVTSLARHIYLEGVDAGKERDFLARKVTPGVKDLLARLGTTVTALRAQGGLDAVGAGQQKRALARLQKVIPALRALGTSGSHQKFVALRGARIELERAADLLDAEPPARALSMVAYDTKTGLYAVYGGDHLDYLSNDIWTFDPKALRWRQRHPRSGPEPRANHFLVGDGKGRLKMLGGYIYHPGKRIRGWESFHYLHAGPGEWVYDLLTDTWRGPAGSQPSSADVRTYRTGGCLPDHFTAGPRPNAAAHEGVLKSLPKNTWVDLKPSKRFGGGRDWGTAAMDPDRDMIYLYSGGHCVYSGADVLHYHLGTNRWDQPVETELPPGYNGAGESVPGWTFNRRAWITGHTWNGYGYHPGLKRLIVNGRQGLLNQHLDPHTYVYDPDLGDWEKRGRTTKAFDIYGTQVRHAPGLGMITWYGRDVWRMNDKTLDWKKLPVKGKLPGSRVDFCGLVYESKRKRVLFFSGGTYQGKPYSGEVFALAIPSLQATSFKPAGSEHIKALYAGKENTLGTWILREVVYHPGADLFIFSSNVRGGYTVALDPKKNRWVGVKLPGKPPWGLSSGMLYDAKRDLIYSVNHRARVSALRLDPKTLVIKPLAEVVAEIKKNGKAKK
jgi:hypothetical protein